MITRIGNMIVKEMIQFRRDWVLATFILLAPALQLILMARNVEQGIARQPVAILDQDRSRLSRQLVTSLNNTEELSVTYYAQGMEDVRRLLDHGNARLAVVIPPRFSARLDSPQSPQQIQVIADGTNTLAASVTMGAATGAVRRLAASLATTQGMVTPELIDFRTDVRFNPTMDFQDFSIPAQLGFITYQVTLAVAALGLARERELGTLEQLMVTPMRRLELAVGKAIPALGVGSLNFAVMWAISLTVFQVPMNGSPALLAALTVLFVAAVVGWGLVISSIARTQQQAILFVFVLAMIEITFSGFMVPVENMPQVLQAVSHVAPLQHYLVIIRGIVLRGAGLEELWLHVVALAALSLAMGVVALRIVSRRLE